MIFTSVNFLIFLTVLLASFGIVRRTDQRQLVLLFASYFFYGAWNVNYLFLIGFCSLYGWWTGLKIASAPNQQTKKLLLVANVVVSLGILAYFKYANFFAENITNLLGLDHQIFEILLPVGISFFTFQAMSYTIDVYRGQLKPCESATKFLLFVSFFPQLVAGPIVRASDFLPQLDKKITLTKENFIVGSQIFLGGAIQKVLFADNLSLFVDPVFASPDLYSGATLWLALLGYSLQIFCDFCGYSLMAIGISRIFGFHLIENFRMPYISLSITEFWRRWHISLSFWLRDYLYISLGGNRKGEFRMYINLMITMLLGGLWHGASWNFVAWGALHGTGLIVHKLWTGINIPMRESGLYKGLSWSVTLLFVMLCWLPFRSPDWNTTQVYLGRMFSLSSDGIDWMPPVVIALLGAAMVWHASYVLNWRFLISFPRTKIANTPTLSVVFSLVMLIILFAPLNTSPFIYFQF